MIATAGSPVRGHCPECRTSVDLFRSRLGIDVRCPVCRTCFCVARERRRRWHRAPRTTQLLFVPPTVPEVIDRPASARAFLLCLIALVVLAVAIAVARVAPKPSTVLERLHDLSGGTP